MTFYFNFTLLLFLLLYFCGTNLLFQSLNHAFTKPKPSLSFNLPHQNDVRGWYLLCFGAKEKEREREEKEREWRQKKQQQQNQQQTEETTAMETDNISDNSHDEQQLEINHNISKVTAIGQQALPPLMSIVTHLDQVPPFSLLLCFLLFLFFVASLFSFSMEYQLIK